MSACRSRLGMFSQPLPLTVGDSSTVYQKPSKQNGYSSTVCVKIGKERSEVGKLKNMLNNPSRGIKDTFERELKSNAIGDSFVDPGQYFLRRPDTNHKLKRQAVNVGG